MSYRGTDDQLERYFIKEGLGQVTIIAISEDDITLVYWRFDSDTGVRIEDEEIPLDYSAMVEEQEAIQTLLDQTQARLDSLTEMIGIIDALLP